MNQSLNLRDRLHIGSALLLILLVAVVAAPFFRSDELAQVSRTNASPSAMIDFPSGYIGSIAAYESARIAIQLFGVPDAITSVRFFIDGEERNQGREFEVLETGGVRSIYLNRAMYPPNVSDGTHSANAIITYGNGNVLTAKKQFRVDYTAPEISLARDDSGSPELVLVSVTDAASGIGGIHIHHVNGETNEFEEGGASIIQTDSDDPKRAEYLISIPDPRKDVVFVALDRAGNKEYLSLTRDRTLEEIGEDFSIRQREQEQSGEPIAQGGPDNPQCELTYRVFYYDASTKNFGDWWGKDASGKLNKLGVFDFVLGSPNIGMKAILNNLISQHGFAYPDFIDFEINPTLSHFKMPDGSGPVKTLYGQLSPYVPVADNYNGLEYNDAFIFALFVQQTLKWPGQIPVIVVDKILNFPGPQGHLVGGYSDRIRGLMVIPYLHYAEGGQFMNENKMAVTFAHEMGHLHGLAHVMGMIGVNLMTTESGNVSGPINADQAAAFMSHTQGQCSEGEAFEFQPAGVYLPDPYVSSKPAEGCGATKDRGIGMRALNSPEIEECENTFSNPFNPFPGSTVIELGAGTAANPLSYCPLVVPFPGLGKRVVGVTPETVEDLKIKYGEDAIRFCIPPGDPDQCTCMTKQELEEKGKKYVTPAPTGDTVPIKPPSGGGTRKSPPTPPPPDMSCGDKVEVTEKKPGDPFGIPIKSYTCMQFKFKAYLKCPAHKKDCEPDPLADDCDCVAQPLSPGGATPAPAPPVP